MLFRMRVLGDGQIDSISSTSDYSSASSSSTSEAGSPREFEIIPAHGSIPPQSEIKVTVRLTSNSIRKYDVSLVVDVDGVGEEIVSLPISAKYVHYTIHCDLSTTDSHPLYTPNTSNAIHMLKLCCCPQ